MCCQILSQGHSTIMQIISPPVEPTGGDTAVTELLAAGSATGLYLETVCRRVSLSWCGKRGQRPV